MLDGLEISEVSFSYLLKSNEIFRIDSIFYLKEFLSSENLILKNKHIKFSQIADNIKSFGAYSLNNMVEYQKSGIPFIRGINMKNGMINFNDMFYITKEANELLHKSEVKPEMILISMSGTIGDIAIAQKEWNYPINSNQDIAKVKINKNYNAYFIYAFFLGKYGQKQIKREARGSVQQHVFLSQIENLFIPIFSNIFQIQIENLVKLAHQKLEDSKKLYKEAEEFLLKELDLLNFKPSNENIATKTLSESFGASGRLDSEYYQPKYDELICHIQKAKYDKLCSIVSIKKSIEPGSEAYQEEGIPFVRVSNITKFGMTAPDIHLAKNLFDENELKKLLPKKDTILLSKDGTVGIAYKIKNETDMITSGALLHLALKRDDVLPEYLTLVLNSLVVQLQAERDAGGSIIQHWKPSEIGEILIPIIDQSIQFHIEEKIKHSFELKEASKNLLELAKKAVEVAIEHNEEEALSLLSQYL